MQSTGTLIYLAISHFMRQAELIVIKRVVRNLICNVKPSESDMKDLELCYQRDPIMCTLDYQELCDFIDEKFGEVK